jgi:hypothetical protein
MMTKTHGWILWMDQGALYVEGATVQDATDQVLDALSGRYKGIEGQSLRGEHALIKLQKAGTHEEGIYLITPVDRSRMDGGGRVQKSPQGG